MNLPNSSLTDQSPPDFHRKASLFGFYVIKCGHVEKNWTYLILKSIIAPGDVSYDDGDDTDAFRRRGECRG